MEENKNVETESKETVVTSTVETEPKAEAKPEKSADEQLAEMRLEMAKLKRALDKSSSETASYKKQLREKQSVDEIQAQEKAEIEAKKQEEFEQMKKELTVSRFEKNFLALGYSEDLASKAAHAQYENDTDELFKIQSMFQTAHDNALKAEWQKSIPELNTGVGNEKAPMSKADFEKLSYLERLDFKNKYPQTYAEYTKK